MEIQNCNNDPRDEECVPTGHGEGEAPFEFECSDGINNDCDLRLDCEETRCHAGSNAYCNQYCDVDADGVRDEPCFGDDCYPGDPTLPVVVNGQTVERRCQDQADDDCNNDGIDCYDSDCRADPSNNCPASEPEENSACYDTRDNDYDTAIDCGDEDCCEFRPDCSQTRPDVCPTPEPSPTPTPQPNPCQYGERRDCNNCSNGVDDDLDGDIDFDDIGCVTSPIIVDIQGDGFDLTGFQNGVNFDLDADGVAERIGWTDTGSDEAFLVLDRNNNQKIDNGKELFGDVTEQPAPPAGEEKNGFLALAVFDSPANGGNSDGQIDPRDSVFSRLRLWGDSNHNGMSEPNEVRRLSVSPIRVFELTYFPSRRTDEHGNRFRYRAIVRDERGAQVGRWAWDVFFVRGP